MDNLNINKGIHLEKGRIRVNVPETAYARTKAMHEDRKVVRAKRDNATKHARQQLTILATLLWIEWKLAERAFERRYGTKMTYR